MSNLKSIMQPLGCNKQDNVTCKQWKQPKYSNIQDNSTFQEGNAQTGHKTTSMEAKKALLETKQD